MLRALYRHPDAGAFWEARCDPAAREVGFEPIQNWPSCCFHAKGKLFPVVYVDLQVYVDDFKMAGPQVNMSRGWKLIQSRINLGNLALARLVSWMPA